MLKKLRRKIILTNMGLVSFVLLIALFVICLRTNSSDTEYLYQGLRQAVDFSLKPAASPVSIGAIRNGDEEPPVAHTPNVVVKLAKDGSLTVLKEDDVSIPEDVLQEVVSLVRSSSSERGKLPGRQLAFYQRTVEEDLIIALGDLSVYTRSLRNTILACVCLFLGGILLFFFISLWLSSLAVKPIERAWQQQKQFIADASHELKTPLTVILANNNIICAHKNETVAQQEQWLHSTAEEAAQMRKLIDQMLLLAKSDASELAPQLLPVDCSELIEEQLLYLEPVAYERNVRLDTELAPHVVLESDRAMLQRLTTILTENAIKYSTPGMAVTVRLIQSHGVRLTVHNYGSPIPAEDLPHIFDRFYRSDKARSTSGYGLGLAIAHTIITQLHGKLSVESSEEAGTTFTAEFRT